MSTAHVRERWGTPEGCKSQHLVRLWCTFRMNMNTAHARERHPTMPCSKKLRFGVGVVHIYDENKHRARTGAPDLPRGGSELPSPQLYEHPQNPYQRKLFGEILLDSSIRQPEINYKQIRGEGAKFNV
jgi:hypothetical protein